MENPNLGWEIDPGNLTRGAVVYKYADSDMNKISGKDRVTVKYLSQEPFCTSCRYGGGYIRYAGYCGYSSYSGGHINRNTRACDCGRLTRSADTGVYHFGKKPDTSLHWILVRSVKRKTISRGL